MSFYHERAGGCQGRVATTKKRWTAGLPTACRLCGFLAEFGDQLDLDAGTHGDLGHAKGTAGVRALVTKDLAK